MVRSLFWISASLASSHTAALAQPGHTELHKVRRLCDGFHKPQKGCGSKELAFCPGTAPAVASKSALISGASSSGSRIKASAPCSYRKILFPSIAKRAYRRAGFQNRPWTPPHTAHPLPDSHSENILSGKFFHSLQPPLLPFPTVFFRVASP
ncbi:hypothetical protein DL89DRAFT_102313 [Linderina pennispora]|uniref:Secreted protein n=1 Tax=Linderina pennispora TaxID=61395 RepID=A0A1Y1WF41_9FUNG|nr:uncharacterized protein DL89DRAFT_102313 [Linderina pennispora]ORX71856.1 hypothetical protein DL89DRAFT_102313 [Linderina pennispora]